MKLEYRGLVVDVSSTSATALAWVEELLAPAFTRDPGPAATAVRLEIDAARHAALLAGGRATGREAECFTRDQGHERLPLVEAADGRLHALDLRRRTALHVRPEGGVDLLAADDERGARVLLMRVVRELAGAHALARGDLPLHASAAVVRGSATLFVGPKGAGKTTLLAHALASGADYLANDRVLVELGESVVARALPTVIRVRPGTRELFPRLADLPDKAHPCALWRALGARAAGEARVRRLILVEPERDAGRFTLARLAPDEAAARLASVGLVAGGTQAALFARPTPALLAARIGELCARVPCLALRLGARAYEAPSVWSSLAALD